MMSKKLLTALLVGVCSVGSMWGADRGGVSIGEAAGLRLPAVTGDLAMRGKLEEDVAGYIRYNGGSPNKEGIKRLVRMSYFRKINGLDVKECIENSGRSDSDKIARFLNVVRFSSPLYPREVSYMEEHGLDDESYQEAIYSYCLNNMDEEKRNNFLMRRKVFLDELLEEREKVRKEATS